MAGHEEIGGECAMHATAPLLEGCLFGAAAVALVPPVSVAVRRPASS
jgi:hypothetical protein